MKKTILNTILVTIFLVSCAPQEIPLQVTVTAEATATVTVYEPTIPSLLTADLAPSDSADTPPEFTAGSGGEVKGISEADLNLLKAWEIYQKVYRDEVGTKTWATKEEFVAEMLKFLSEKTDLGVEVQQDADTGKVLVAIVKKAGDQSSVYWGFDDGVLVNTNPMSLRAESESGLVNLPKGTTPEFRFNAQDGHWYMFAVDTKSETVDWFATDGATEDNLEEHMVEVEKPITNLSAWAKTEGEKVVIAVGYGSYGEYVQAELVASPDYDTENKNGGNIYEVFGFTTAEGLVMMHKSVPVLTEYWKNLGVTMAEVLLMAFDHTEQAVPVLAGFHMQDGSYVPILVFEAGSNAEDIGQDKPLKKPGHLDHLVGQLRSVRMIDRLNPGPNLDLRDPGKGWDVLKTSTNENPYTSNMQYSIFKVRSAQELEMLNAAIYNPEGYAWTALFDGQGNLAQTSAYREALVRPDGELLSLLGGKMDARLKVSVRAYLFARGDGGADNWLIVMSMAQNSSVFLR